MAENTRLTLIIILLLLPAIVSADTITIAWDANKEDDLAGYIVYWGPEIVETYPNSVDVGNVTEYEINVPYKTFIVVTAYDNDNNESEYSKPIRYIKGIGVGSSRTMTIMSGNKMIIKWKRHYEQQE